jgi:hypothetical protein
MNKGLEHLTHCSTGVEETVKISSDKVTCRSKSQEELIKSIYNFSVMLLSSCDGGYQLKESEHALVQSVIQNLRSLKSMISKVWLYDTIPVSCHNLIRLCFHEYIIKSLWIACTTVIDLVIEEIEDAH